MSILSSCLMGVHGGVYAGAGVCMLLPVASSYERLREVTKVYALAFKPVRVIAHDNVDETGERQEELVPNESWYRMLGYLLLLLGVCRMLAAFHWGCGYVHLTLLTCAGEVALVCNELLRYESMHLQRAVFVLLNNMFMSILYIAMAIPYCR